MTALEQPLSTEERTVNSRQMMEHLAEVHGQMPQPRPPETITQKKDIGGNGLATVIAVAKTPGCEPGNRLI
jgi:hypothetical protein